MANGIRKDYLKRKIRAHAVKVTPAQIQKALREQFDQSARTLVDREYLAAPYWLLKPLLQYSGVSKYRYVPEVSDCDDLAYYLRGELPCKLGFNGVGVVLDYSAGHAYCAILTWLDGDLHVALVEPQTDEIVTAGDRMYDMERVAIHF